MELPEDNAGLTEIFAAAASPTIDEFVGEYWVDMLTGPLPNMRKLGHRKMFRRADSGETRGCNILFKNLKWGNFFLKIPASDFDGKLSLEINYDLDANLFSRGIRDRVRRIDEGEYLGRFHYVIFGKPRFLAYFTLTKARKPRAAVKPAD